LGSGEIVEGLVVVSIEGSFLLTLEAAQRAVILIPVMVGQLACGVVAFPGAPFGLFGGEARDRDACRDEPIFLVVGGVQLLQQYTAKGGGRLLVLGRAASGIASSRRKASLLMGRDLARR
jgi:hypothetical protein